VLEQWSNEVIAKSLPNPSTPAGGGVIVG